MSCQKAGRPRKLTLWIRKAGLDYMYVYEDDRSKICSFAGPSDVTQKKLDQLIQERQAMENDFSQKRAKFMEMFKQKEGRYQVTNTLLLSFILTNYMKMATLKLCSDDPHFQHL